MIAGAEEIGVGEKVGGRAGKAWLRPRARNSMSGRFPRQVQEFRIVGLNFDAARLKRCGELLVARGWCWLHL